MTALTRVCRKGRTWDPAKGPHFNCGRVLSAEWRAKISAAKLGKKLSPEQVAAIINGKRQKGTLSPSPEQRELRSKKWWAEQAHKVVGVPKPVVTCPVCGRTGGAPIMGRWHGAAGEKCKQGSKK